MNPAPPVTRMCTIKILPITFKIPNILGEVYIDSNVIKEKILIYSGLFHKTLENFQVRHFIVNW